jgi:Phage protein D
MKGKIKELRYVYANEKSAIEAAKSELKKIEQGIAQFKLKLALGRPDLFTEMPVEVDGFKPEINSTKWTIAKCSHSLNKSGGFTTEVELEIKPEEESYENIYN